MARVGIWINLIILSRIIFQASVRLGGRYNVRTFFEEDMEIPIYEIPLPQGVRTP